jgi:hypothetical protein
MPYIIVKKMTDSFGNHLNVIINGGDDEILEIESEESAKKLLEIFNKNSDSGWSYELRNICKRDSDGSK